MTKTIKCIICGAKKQASKDRYEKIEEKGLIDKYECRKCRGTSKKEKPTKPLEKKGDSTN